MSDFISQIRRAAISITSNIAEGEEVEQLRQKLDI